MVLNLEEDNVGAVLFGCRHRIKEGDTVKRTGTVGVGSGGRSADRPRVNALGQPIDGKGPIATDQLSPTRRLERRASSSASR